MRPSDLDLALVDVALFDEAWSAMKSDDLNGNFSGVTDRERKNVYWGRIAEEVVPKRTPAALGIRSLSDAVRRTSTFRGYGASVRIYREAADLESYTVWSLGELERGLRRP